MVLRGKQFCIVSSARFVFRVVCIVLTQQVADEGVRDAGVDMSNTLGCVVRRVCIIVMITFELHNERSRRRNQSLRRLSHGER